MGEKGDLKNLWKNRKFSENGVELPEKLCYNEKNANKNNCF